MLGSEEIVRSNRRAQTEAAQKRRADAEKWKRLKLLKAQREMRIRARNTGQVEFLKRGAPKDLQRANQRVNESAPLETPKLALSHKNESLAITTANLTRTPAKDRPEPVRATQYVSRGNVRQRRRSIRKNLDQAQARLLKKILSLNPRVQANQTLAREIIKELGLKFTRVVDIGPQILEHLRENYPSLVQDFIHRRKIRSTRLLGPLKVEWASIWREFKRIKGRPKLLQGKRDEISAFLDYERTVEHAVSERYYTTKYSRDTYTYENRSKYFNTQPDWLEVVKRRKELSEKYRGEEISSYRVRELQREIESTGKISPAFVNRVRTFNESLEFVKQDRKLHGKELRQLLHLPNLKST